MFRWRIANLTLGRFLKEERGTSTLIFGLAAFALMAAVGTSIDYARAAANRARMQSVIDSTALSLARVAYSTDQATMQTRGEAIIRGRFSSQSDFTISSVVVTKNTRSVDIAVNAITTTRIARVIGNNQTNWSATTQVAWGGRKVEIALVLDNTQSMSSSGKMTALRDAATRLVNIMETAATEPDSVRIALIPFNTTVKVGSASSGQAWLTLSNIPSNQRSSWDGCVTDRNQPFDTNDTAYLATNTNTRYPAVMCPQTSLAQAMPLTADFAALRTRISTMTPAGTTNVTIGLVWGLAALSPYAPLSGAVDYGTPEVDKYMIVLTDGQNTQNRWTSTTSQIDARTELACDTARTLKVKTFTVRLIDGNTTLLRDCATETSMFYDVTSSAQLVPVFQQIASSIARIRLTN